MHGRVTGDYRLITARCSFAAHKSHLIAFDRVEQFNNLSLPQHAILKSFCCHLVHFYLGPGG